MIHQIIPSHKENQHHDQDKAESEAIVLNFLRQRLAPKRLSAIHH